MTYDDEANLPADPAGDRAAAGTAPAFAALPPTLRSGETGRRDRQGMAVMKEPVDHVLRPRLPWRSGDAAITECGYDASQVRTLTRAEFFQRLKDLGKQRSAMLTCMTCSNTAGRWGTWEDDPRVALEREITWEHGGGYRSRTDRGELLKDELIAIAALIENHGDEFQAIVTASTQRREWLEKKAARKAWQ